MSYVSVIVHYFDTTGDLSPKRNPRQGRGPVIAHCGMAAQYADVPPNWFFDIYQLR